MKNSDVELRPCGDICFGPCDARIPTDPPGSEAESGIYVYSIIECAEPRTFGKIGIGGRGDDVYTVHYKDLAAVVSRTPLVVYDPTRENVARPRARQRVIIEEGFTPVPMSFGTLFKTEKDIVEFLEDTYDALRDVLVKMKDKLEFGLRVNWAREEVLAEIERDDEGIRRLKEEISKSQQVVDVLRAHAARPHGRAGAGGQVGRVRARHLRVPARGGHRVAVEQADRRQDDHERRVPGRARTRPPSSIRRCRRSRSATKAS